MNNQNRKITVHSENAKRAKIVISKNSIPPLNAIKSDLKKIIPTEPTTLQRPCITYNKELPTLSPQAESYKAMLYGLQGAALQARLPYFELSNEEATHFPDLSISSIQKQHYLHIRNRILCMWLHNPKEQLTFETVLKQLNYKAEHKLIRNVYLHLERYGYINYGIFKIEHKRRLTNNARVIVVGAGIAGVIAARQLQYLGFEVVVLEARDRVGGRIATFRHDPNIADLGPLVLHGVHGNPLSVLAQQGVIELTPCFWKLKMHQASGRPIPEQQVKLVDQQFDKIIADIVSIQQQLNECFDDNSAVNLTLANAIEIAFQKRRANTFSEHESFLKEVLELQQQMLQKYEITLDTNRDYRKCKQLKENLRQASLALKKRELLIKMRDTARQLKVLQESCQQLQEQLNEVKQDSAYRTYMSVDKEQLFNWHVADLEATYGSSISDISLKHLCDKIDYRFIGPQSTLRAGMSYLPLYLTKDLQVRKNTRVLNISYNAKGVQLSCESVNGKIRNAKTMLQAEFLVCTLPIGVLKDVVQQESGQTGEVVTFSPPLPHWKQSAIERMGVGLVNRVVLFFDRIFWDTKYNAFGNVNTAAYYRGEFYMFYSVAKTPVLSTSISGKLAWKLEQADDAELTNRCMFILRQMFGEQRVPDPQKTLVTRWGSDVCSRGSTSFASADTLLSDYDSLAAPLSVKCGNGMEIPRVFFAGEHTIRHYAGTVHGAFLSGLREAGRIASYQASVEKI